MPAISAAIAEARDKGDLSENAEYDAARDSAGAARDADRQTGRDDRQRACHRRIEDRQEQGADSLAGDAVEPYQREADVLHDRIGKRSEPARGRTRHRYAHCQGASGQEEGRSGGRGGSRRVRSASRFWIFRSDAAVFPPSAGPSFGAAPSFLRRRGGGGVRPAAERAASGAADGRCGECRLRGERPRSPDTADAGSEALCAGLPDGRRSPHRTEARRLDGYEGRRCCHRSIRIVVRTCAGALTLLRRDGQPAGSAACGNAAAARYRLRSTKEIIRRRICRV